MYHIQTQNDTRSSLACKTAAILEVLGVFIAGNFTAGYLGDLLGVKPLGSFFNLAPNSTEPDFIALSVGWAQIMCVQYACLLPPAFVIGWWRRRWGLAHYGITTARQRVWFLVVVGLIAFALVGLPFRLLLAAKQFIPLGPDPAVWVLMGKSSWTPSFWLFMAVSGVLLTPVLEELFYRSYCQTRLEEDFGGIGAIVIVTLFMTLGHNQFFRLNSLSIGILVSMIPFVLGLGYVYWRTRSILPAVILHGLGNLPTKGIYDFLLPALMVTVLVLFRKKWLSMVQDFGRQMAGKGWKKAALAGALLACAIAIGFEAWSDVFIPLGFLSLAVALIIEFRERRLERNPARNPS